MNKTNIEWVLNPDGTQGYTWNPITGCLNHDNGLCKGGGFPCYACKLANGRLKPLYLANLKLSPTQFGDRVTNTAEEFHDPFYPRFWERRMYQLRGTGDYDNAYPDRNAYNASREKEKGIFVCNMGDLFGDCIPRSWQDQVFNAIKANPDYRFYLLTKQPQNLIKFSPFPPNCYVGVSVTKNSQLDNALKYLKQIEATVKFISFEPLLERIDLQG